MLLHAKRSILAMVDLQERLVPALQEPDRLLRHAGILAAAADRLEVPIVVTEQYPKGLGPTVATLAETLPKRAVTLSKVTFSAMGAEAIAGALAQHRQAGRDQIVVCGAEAHVCVLQTALAMKENGFEVFVVGDAVSSRSPHSVSAACARLLHADCHWITTEMAVFEWLERAGTDTFREVSALIK